MRKRRLKRIIVFSVISAVFGFVLLFIGHLSKPDLKVYGVVCCVPISVLALNGSLDRYKEMKERDKIMSRYRTWK